MQVKLGDEVAQCQHCGGTQFVPAEPGEEDADVCDLICTGCEWPTTRGVLILQIGHTALHSAWQYLSGNPV